MMAREIFAHEPQLEVEVLDLSRLTSEYGRIIYPCKTCVSTAMPLCHWPCSCYPNHALGQVQDWMNDIYAMWAAAHGVMIVCPVNWYGPPSGLKLMMDRLVCADGGNPDPTSTHGKKAEEAKALELAGWPYPQHLAGRVFSVVVHGDYGGDGDGARRDRGLAARHRPDRSRAPVATARRSSATCSPMPPATTTSTATPRSRRRCATPRARWSQAVKLMRRGELKQPDAGLRTPRKK